MQNHLSNDDRGTSPGGIRPGRASGFSLAEVLVSVLILGIVALSGLQLFSVAIACDNNAHRNALSSALLQNEVEYIRTMGGITTTDTHYTSVVASGSKSTATIISLQGAIMPSCKIVMTLDTNFNTTYNLKKITGKLYWNMGGNNPYPTNPQGECYTVMSNRQKHVGG